jgi:hypothetical protein
MGVASCLHLDGMNFGNLSLTFEFRLAPFPVGHHPIEKPIELRPMMMVTKVTELMGDYVIYGIHG